MLICILNEGGRARVNKNMKQQVSTLKKGLTYLNLLMENDCRHFYFWLRMNKKNLELRNRVCLRFKGPSQIKTSICITKKFLSEFAKIIILQVIVFIDFLRVAICLYVISSSLVCISIIITQLHVTVHIIWPLCAASMYCLYTPDSDMWVLFSWLWYG